MDYVSDFLELGREIEIVRSVVNGISTYDQQRIDGARGHVIAKGAQRFQLIDGRGLHRFGVINGVAYVAQSSVNRVGQRVNLRGLVLSRYNQRSGAMRLQLPANC